MHCVHTSPSGTSYALKAALAGGLAASLASASSTTRVSRLALDRQPALHGELPAHAAIIPPVVIGPGHAGLYSLAAQGCLPVLRKVDTLLVAAKPDRYRLCGVGATLRHGVFWIKRRTRIPVVTMITPMSP